MGTGEIICFSPVSPREMHGNPTRRNATDTNTQDLHYSSRFMVNSSLCRNSRMHFLLIFFSFPFPFSFSFNRNICELCLGFTLLSQVVDIDPLLSYFGIFPVIHIISQLSIPPSMDIAPNSCSQTLRLWDIFNQGSLLPAKRRRMHIVP